MKIRIKGNSIRMRITQTEVSQLCKTGYIEEKTQFPQNTFTYALSSMADAPELTANFEQNKITLVLPSQIIEGWENNKKIGFSNSIFLNDKNKLSLLVEKDFTCLDDRGEDESDNYPNPKLQH
ncbi:DUF7009 family protein [Zobellia alginiliquefaciens]|uniref:DUF7009 family protein n=1 Tax=Zobellia alginiliquefaciens TaxID=3032586 RepID=UPI0023E3CA11|nr:hypothetical protein [Zobellia alginiliquefaciens]